MGGGVWDGELYAGIGVGYVVSLVVAVGHVDSIGSEAPDAKDCGDVRGAADETGVDGDVWRDGCKLSVSVIHSLVYCAHLCDNGCKLKRSTNFVQLIPVHSALAASQEGQQHVPTVDLSVCSAL